LDLMVIVADAVIDVNSFRRVTYAAQQYFQSAAPASD